MEHPTTLMQKAEPWVSTFVLWGCILITVVLVYAAYKAQVFAQNLASDTSVTLNSF
jgi:hypothetical protein